MDERTREPAGEWPLPLSSVLELLEVDHELHLDVGAAGTLAVRLLPRTVAPDADPLPALSERAGRVLRLVSDGRPAAVVSERLGLPLSAVAHELGLLRARYGVDSTAAAVQRARAVGDLD